MAWSRTWDSGLTPSRKIPPRFKSRFLIVHRLGTFYNAAPGPSRKNEVEEWAKGNYPEIWAELEKQGLTTTAEGEELFNIKRDLRA
jgi:hypothetical protein